MRQVTRNDQVVVTAGKLFMDFGAEMYVYNFQEINSISILTTSERLLNDKVFLVFDTVNEVYVMGITHPLFRNVLYKQVAELFELDPDIIIDAMQSSEDHKFVLYDRNSRRTEEQKHV